MQECAVNYDTLTSRSSHGDLACLREEMEGWKGPRPAHVFLPIVPVYRTAKTPRLLIVGQATYDYSQPELESYDGAFAANVGVIRDRDTAFWRFIWNVTEGALRHRGLPCEREAAMETVGWSNLAKIGAVVGNPRRRSVKKQAALCVEAVRAEIAHWRPHATVFLTSDFARDDVLMPSFGASSWTEHQTTDHVWFKEDVETGCPLIWTLHPDRKSREVSVLTRTATIDLLHQAILRP
jgi:hypothetical protein